MKTKLSFLAAIATATLIFFGCSSSKSLTTNSWQVTEINGNAITTYNENFTLTFSDTDMRIFGKGECNRYFATYAKEGSDKIIFTNSGSTKMMCPNQTQEDDYISTLNNVNSYSFSGKALELKQGDKVILKFIPIPLISSE